jgi:hypothetical protein
VGKELDDICTSCPYIDAVKRHKQQLGAIEEYTQWLKKEPRASYFFLFQLYTRIHNTFFSQKQQLPFTPGGTHCPEPDVTLRDLTLSPGYHSDYAPQPIPEMDSSAVVPPTNENTSPPEDTPDNTLRLIPFEASGTAGSSPLRGHRFLPTSHNTARLSCSNTRMRSAVLSALSRFQCTDNAS